MPGDVTNMKCSQSDGLATCRFDGFDHPNLLHAVSTRHGGVSEGAFATLNLGHTVGDDPARVEENHRRLFEALGIDRESVASARQVHGNAVARVREGDGGRVFADTDALICDVPGLFLLLRFADCAPVFLHAPGCQAVGLAHAGWKGTLLSIAPKAAKAMVEAFGCTPGEIVAAIGPAIGPCCFEVGQEVVEELASAHPALCEQVIDRRPGGGRVMLDLPRLNLLQLREAGVGQVEMAGLCTMCLRETFYSHRAEHGVTGRFAALIGLREDRR